MMQFAETVALSLLKAVLSRQSLMLRFDDRERNCFSAFRYWPAK